MQTRSKVKHERNSIKPESEKLSERTVWTDEDKELLLKAVKLHGVSNINEISRMIPKHNKQSIQNFIKNQLKKHKQYKLINIVNLNNGPMKCLRLTKDTEKSAVDLWLDVFRKIGSIPPKHFNALTFFMKLMSDFGEHDTAVNEDIDFKRLYLYMSHILQGMKPCEINEKSEEFIRRSLEQLAVEHREQNRFNKERTFLKDLQQTIISDTDSSSIYPENSFLEAMEDINVSRILNPLNIPFNFMKLD